MSEYDRAGDIAIIGMSGRFPGAKNLEEFWHNLKNGVESISFFDDDQIIGSGVSPSVLRHPNYVKAGSVLKDIDLFDAPFFGFSTREAEITDPQHRIFMECAWEALENAGYNPKKSNCSIGVFAGKSISNYLLFNLLHTLDLTKATNYLQNLIGNDKDYLTTHTSYKLNLKGLSVSIQTACSTSLVSVILGCDSLLSYQCDIALAGGITVRVPQEIGYIYEEGSILSPDGHCRSFDAQAGGTIYGSGVGIVVLKRLEDAIADRDCIHAIIKGTAINNDGALKVGYTAPSVDGQSEVIAMAHAMAGIDAETISYIEAHGTGTNLGDPIEIAALTQVFRTTTQKKGFCAIGSVKTNIGHLDAAAGVAGLIKTVLALKYKLLPPSLHFEEPNPQIDFANSPFYVNTKLSEWKTDGKPRCAGVSSFGMGGTNAHVILEEAPALIPVANQVERSLHILSLSAKSQKALQELASRYENFLASHPEASHPDICFTAHTGRTHFNCRLAVVSESIAQMREQLGTFVAGVEAAGLVSGQVNEAESPKIAFLFTGQGSQYIGMGRQLYEEAPIFRQTLDRCNDILRPYLEKSLLSILYPESEETSPIDETAYTQPALFALEYSLYELWKSWGIKPDIVIGHSIGEYVAATVAEIFSLEDALKLITERGRLMQALTQNGKMVAVFASESKVREAIQAVAVSSEVAIAAINSPQNTVISGGNKAVEAVCAVLEAEGIKTKKLKVSHAFHSPMMEPILADFEKVAASIAYSAPKIELSSNVTGKLIGSEIATPEYWCRHIKQPVRFAEGMKTLHDRGCEVFVEIGPNPTLLDMGHQCLDEVGVFIPSLRQRYSDWQQLLQSLAALYVRGVQVDWFGFDQNYLRSRLELPTYPFQRQRYWIDKPGILIDNKSHLALNGIRNQVIHPLLGQRLQSAALKNNEIQFESKISENFPAFLEHHRIYQQTIFPASGYLEMALFAGAEVFKSDKLILEEFVIHQVLILPPNQEKTLQLILTPTGNLEYSFQIFSFNQVAEQSADLWILHASAKLLLSEKGLEIPHVNLEQLTQRSEEISPEDYYQKCCDQAIDYGASFQGIERLWRQNGEVLGQIRLPEALHLEAVNYKLHPSLLDACFQVLKAGIHNTNTEDTYVLVGLERLAVFGYPDSTLWSYAQMRPVKETNQQTLTADLQLVSPDGRVIITVEGLVLKQVSSEALVGTAPQLLLNSLYEVEWRSQARLFPLSPAENLLTPSAISERILPQVNEAIGDQSKNWLILADSLGIGQQLATFLRARSQTCTLIFSGKNYEQLAEQEFRIDLASFADFQQLLKETVGTGIRGVVHLWSLEAPEAQDLTVTDLEAASHKACGSTLYLVQALVKAELKQPPTLWLVTRGAILVGVESAVPGVAQSPLWGMGKVIALEYPEFNCVRVDLDPNAPDDNAQTLFEEIWSKSSEDQVAFCKGNRLVPRLVSRQFQAPVVHNKLNCRGDSTYLITGGLGYLGLLVARWLVECGAKYLVILGRSSASFAANSQLRELEQMGTQVVVRMADVSQEGQIAQVLAEIKQSLPPLRGVIHAAGVIDDSTLLQLSWERFSQVMASKVEGAWNLHTLTQDTPLEFFVLFSSLSSLLGNSGQANYAAANAFLDALAHYRRNRGLAGLSINWGVWSLKESTPEPDRREGERLLRRKGMEFINFKEGLQVLNYLLLQSSVQVGVLPVKWSKFLQQFPPGGEPPFFSEFVYQLQQQVKDGQSQVKQIELIRRLKEASANERLELLVAYLQDGVAKVLGISSSQQIDPNQSLNELGFDSLMSIDFKNKIKNELGIELPIRKIAESSSVVQLALALIEQLALTSLIQSEQPSNELTDNLEEIIL